MGEEDQQQNGGNNSNNNANISEDEQAAREARAEKVRQRREEMKTRAESNNSNAADFSNEPSQQQQSRSAPSSSDSNSNSQPTPAPAKLREDLVASSVNFLNHPKVKPSPLTQKTSFLQKKGLTQEEINEAFRRVGESSPSDSSSQGNRNQSNGGYVNSPSSQQNQPYYPPQQQQQQVYRPPPPQQLPPPPPQWYHTGSGLALIALGCVGLGAGVSALAKTVLPYLTGENVAREEKRRRKKAKEEEKQANDAKTMSEMMNSIKSLQEKNDSLQENLRNILQSQNEKQREAPESMSKTDKARLRETEAELKRLRAVLVDKNVSGSLSTSQSWTPQKDSKPSLPAWQMASSSTPKVEEPSSPKTEKVEKEESRIEEIPEEKETAPVVAPPDEPVNSSKFEEVMNMVKSGKIPDDVRNIDDKPRDTDAKIEKGAREPRQKPWERKNDSN
eukprot:TRINITY_DN704_c0_g1_i1.p1 TRINITY_DN704_c0_g1~~TRINITY_DN704_c0_g1_i1.p1  ORF type:complete len:446 (+),score=218.80 TRINITY_DN704_c0_g1_i1:132-1469(+)